MAKQLTGAPPERKKLKTLRPSTTKRIMKKQKVFLQVPIESILQQLGRPATPNEIAELCHMEKSSIQKKLLEAQADGRVRIARRATKGSNQQPALWEAA
jgi:DNA-directed RNA polymerase specialized sigma subunit